MGRSKYLHHPEIHGKFLKRCMVWGLGLGITLQVINLLLNSALEQGMIKGNPVLFVTKALITSVSPLLLALGYVCGLTLLCLRPRWNNFLSFLAPAGRMTLTNYIMQSVLLWIVFYGSGLGMHLKIGPSITLLIALAFCCLQLAYSFYWLRYFKMGPLEWVWRYANTGKRPEWINSLKKNDKAWRV
jgi:uncharacterized protein